MKPALQLLALIAAGSAYAANIDLTGFEGRYKGNAVGVTPFTTATGRANVAISVSRDGSRAKMKFSGLLVGTVQSPWSATLKLGDGTKATTTSIVMVNTPFPARGRFQQKRPSKITARLSTLVVSSQLVQTDSFKVVPKGNRKKLTGTIRVDVNGIRAVTYRLTAVGR